jgi:polysaccharide biosynthesis/export protein
MQPARLGALVLCLVPTTLLVQLVLAPPSSAQQAVLETPQQVNDRIHSMSASARVMQRDYIIGNGDLLDIDVFDVKELSREVRVSQTGTIGVPLVPVRVHVSGLTEIQAEQKVAELLESNGLVSHPDVSITVKERKSKPITVVGAVAHPMVYQADRPVSLLEVLAEAGGVANDAGDTVIITRAPQDLSDDSSEPPAIGPESSVSQPNASAKSSLSSAAAQGATPNPASPSDSAPSQKTASTPSSPSSAAASAPTADQPASSEPPPLNNTITVNLGSLLESGDATNNITLQAGDVVTVPHAGIVYVLGAVTKPGGFVLSNDRGQMSALKVLSLAGGLTTVAKSDHAVIVRKDTQGQQHEVPVDLKKVLQRQQEDVQLQPSDILYVPNSAGKQAMLRALEFGLALGSGVALYRIAYH